MQAFFSKILTKFKYFFSFRQKPLYLLVNKQVKYPSILNFFLQIVDYSVLFAMIAVFIVETAYEK